MDTVLLGITVVSLIVALIMSVTAWRLMREEKRRTAARIAALSTASFDATETVDAADSIPLRTTARPEQVAEPARIEPFSRGLWKPASLEPADDPTASVSQAPGFLGSSTIDGGTGNGQRGLAIATVVFFIAITGGFIWTMAGSETSPAAAAASSDTPLELLSLSHTRQNDKLAVSGLVRNPVSGRAVENLSAVVFLFDRAGTFVTSSRAQVDFLKLGAGDESPFVVSIDAPESVSRYRVSFRTDDGVMPHVDRRGESPAAAVGEQPVNVTSK
jgi:hypothetical protein